MWRASSSERAGKAKEEAGQTQLISHSWGVFILHSGMPPFLQILFLLERFITQFRWNYQI